MKIDYNYHAHTDLCGHASGTPEEYVLKAIQGRITHMGFSDHCPLRLEDGYEANFRVPTQKAREYIAEIRALKEKYKSKIDLHVGFEMEYYPSLFDSMLQYARDIGAQYLILGQHYLDANDERKQMQLHCIQPTTDEEKLKTYVSYVVSAIKIGAFTYVAHPDIFQFTGNVQRYQQEMRKICEASKAYDIPLEINCLGIRDKRCYPNSAFWEMAGQVQCPVTCGFDAHDINAAYDQPSLAQVKALIEKYDLNYIGKPSIKLL